MLLICTGFTAVSAIITFFYSFYKISYAELAQKVGWTIDQMEKDYEKGRDPAGLLTVPTGGILETRSNS